MSIAFLILAHADPVHLGRLCRSLQGAGDVYIHLDRKADKAAFEAEVGTSGTFIEERHAVAWAGISMVDAILALMRVASDQRRGHSRLVLLTGSDYPIKPMGLLKSLFEQQPDREFIRYIDMRESPEHYLKLVSRRYFREPIIGNGSAFADKALRKMMTMLRLPNRWPRETVPYFGHTWCALTAHCVRYILAYHDAHAAFYRANTYTFAPDEHYFHTIVGNSSFAAAATGLQPYQGRGLWRLANLHLIDPSLQKWFTISDWDTIIGSDRFFVRKINSTQGTELVRRLDTEVLGAHDR